MSTLYFSSEDSALAFCRKCMAAGVQFAVKPESRGRWAVSYPAGTVG